MRFAWIPAVVLVGALAAWTSASAHRRPVTAQDRTAKETRKTLGMMRQRLRIAQIPPAAKVEVRRFFAEAHKLGLTLEKGHTEVAGRDRYLRLVYGSHPGATRVRRHEISLMVSPGGEKPALLVRRIAEGKGERRMAFTTP